MTGGFAMSFSHILCTGMRFIDSSAYNPTWRMTMWVAKLVPADSLIIVAVASAVVEVASAPLYCPCNIIPPLSNSIPTPRKGWVAATVAGASLN